MECMNDLRTAFKEVQEEVDEAAVWAAKQADPDPATATTHIYDENPPELDYEATEPSGELVVMVDAINHGILETNANGMLDLQDAQVLLRRLLGTFPTVADTNDLISSPGGDHPIPLISGADQQSVVDSWN